MDIRIVGKALKAFGRDETGATAIEYALMSSLIALVLIASLTALGTRLGVEFNEVSSALK
jgi:pilus assembly protein Flp/PilA